jgi:hypothetical protein
LPPLRSGTAEELPRRKGDEVAVERDRGVIGGITLGGIIVIVGIIVALLWSVWLASSSPSSA